MKKTPRLFIRRLISAYFPGRLFPRLFGRLFPASFFGRLFPSVFFQRIYLSSSFISGSGVLLSGRPKGCQPASRKGHFTLWVRPTDSQQASGPGDPGFSSFHILFRASFPGRIFPRLCFRAYFPRVFVFGRLFPRLSFRAFPAYFRRLYFSASFISNVG